MKKFCMLTVLALLFLSTIVFAACNSGSPAATDADSFTVGVLQFGSHPSLDNCYQGIEQGLAGSGLQYTLDRQDGNFDSATCDTIAKNMVAKNYDIIFAIATPAALSAYAAAENSSIPVIFCAVSDPLAAGLVDDAAVPGGHCTGTSDQLDLAGQVALIQALQPDVSSIGVLYTTSEANSISHLQSLREILAPLGIDLVEQGVQTAADIPQAASSLAAKVDCINNFTDNNVVNNLQVVLEKAAAAGIPVYGSEIEQVRNGCLAAASIDYVALGKETAALGSRVLKGENVGEIPVSFISTSTPVINIALAEQLNITIPAEFANAEMIEE